MNGLPANPLRSLASVVALVALIAISASSTIAPTLARLSRAAPIPPTEEPAADPALPPPSATPAPGVAKTSSAPAPSDASPRYPGVTSRGLIAGMARGSTPVTPPPTVAFASTATTQPSPTPTRTATPQPTVAPANTPQPTVVPANTLQPAATPTSVLQPTAIPTQTTAPAPAGSAPSSPAVPSAADLSAAQAALGLINQSRSQNGLPALTAYEPLRQEAQAFADDMGSRGYFGHNTPEGLGPGDRMKAAGLTPGRWAENIGNGYGSPTAAVTQLHQLMMAEVAPNDGHKQNILSPNLHRVGIGVVTIAGGRTYYVTDFID